MLDCVSSKLISFSTLNSEEPKMLSTFANLILVGTAWSPVILVIGVHEALCRKSWCVLFAFAIAAFVLFLACIGIFKIAKSRSPGETVEFKEFERKDQEVLTFILITMLPIMRSSNESIVGNPLVTILVAAIITVTLLQARAYHFNPLIRLLGYRCYSVRTMLDTPILLICKKDLRLPGKVANMVKLTDFVWLQK